MDEPSQSNQHDSAVWRALFAAEDARRLAFFRICFGLVMMAECGGGIFSGFVKSALVEPKLFFKYAGFGWVQPIDGYSFYLHFTLLAVAATLVTIGLFYRAAAAFLFVGWSYVFFMDLAWYQNHYYLIVLLTMVMAVLPAHRALSIDARRKPTAAVSTFPAWMTLTIKLLMATAYFYAGVAKLSSDWLALQPVTAWMQDRADRPILGWFYGSRWSPYFIAWGGVVFDLSIPFLLFGKRPATLAFAATCVFHLMNAITFEIGVFPFLALAMTALFLPLSSLDGLVPDVDPARPAYVDRRPRLVIAALLALFIPQALLPLRHFFIPGNVHWTEQGHLFAWHMKLREKTGTIRFIVKDSNRVVVRTVTPEEYLSGRQLARVATRPELIRQLAVRIGHDARRAGVAEPTVHAEASVSLNSRRPQPFIDTQRDLTKVPAITWQRRDWILPLTEPLPRPR